jgi:hypothetical protein
MRRLLLLLLILVCPLFAAKKEAEWRTGHLLSASREHWISTSGSSTNGNIDQAGNYHAQTTQNSWGHNTYYVALEDSQFVYYAERTLSWRWQHDPHFTENADVPWMLDKDNLTVKDDTGREFKMKLVKRRKK